MPHCTLEYSANIGSFDTKSYFEGLHRVLKLFPELPFLKIKSRALCHDIFYIGDGSADNAFIYLHLAILSGREGALKARIGESLLDYTRGFFLALLDNQRVSFNVELREIPRDALFYSGNLGQQK